MLNSWTQKGKRLYQNSIFATRNIDRRTITLLILCRIMNNKLHKERSDFMLAVNYSTIRNNLKRYCDEATDNGETIIVTRKEEKNIVIMSFDKYNQMEKAARNAEYLARLDRGIEQLASGRGQMHELIEVEDE
jgi:antitoxin YefM